MTERLEPLERAVIDMLLAGDNVILAGLRRQLAAAAVNDRHYTGVGLFIDFAVPDSLRLRITPPSFHLGDVEASIQSVHRGVGFVLFVEDGLLSALEGYTYDEPWPAEIHDFDLRYHEEPRRLAPPVLK